MGLSYHDTDLTPLPGRGALQWAGTVRLPLMSTEGPRTHPAVHDSGSAPLGDEAAYVPCRGWCERRGRGCDRQCEAGAVLDDEQIEAAYRSTRRDNSDDGYRSRPVPLRDEHVTPQMIGTAWAHGLALTLAVLVAVWAAHEWLLPVVRQWAMGWL